MAAPTMSAMLGRSTSRCAAFLLPATRVHASELGTHPSRVLDVWSRSWHPKISVAFRRGRWARGLWSNCSWPAPRKRSWECQARAHSYLALAEHAHFQWSSVAAGAEFRCHHIRARHVSKCPFALTFCWRARLYCLQSLSPLLSAHHDWAQYLFHPGSIAELISPGLPSCAATGGAIATMFAPESREKLLAEITFLGSCFGAVFSRTLCFNWSTGSLFGAGKRPQNWNQKSRARVIFCWAWGQEPFVQSPRCWTPRGWLWKLVRNSTLPWIAGPRSCEQDKIHIQHMGTLVASEAWHTPRRPNQKRERRQYCRSCELSTGAPSIARARLWFGTVGFSSCIQVGPWVGVPQGLRRDICAGARLWCRLCLRRHTCCNTEALVPCSIRLWHKYQMLYPTLAVLRCVRPSWPTQVLGAAVALDTQSQRPGTSLNNRA